MTEKTEERRKQAKLEEMAEWSRSLSLWNPLFMIILVASWFIARWLIGTGDGLTAVTSVITVIITRLLDERATTIGYYFGSSKKQKE